jgi:hypothetical protein
MGLWRSGENERYRRPNQRQNSATLSSGGACSGGLDGQKQFELRGQLFFRIQAVREIYPPDAAVGVNLDPESFDVIGAVSAAREVAQVELDLVPALVQAHGHGANEGLHPRGCLVVGRPEPPAHILIVQHLHFEREVLLHIFNDHHQKGQLDAQSFLGISRAADVVGAHVGAADLEHTGLNVLVRDTLDVPIPYCLVPNLQRFASNGIQDGQEP